ncbi:MAG: tyrosine-type recombinase/integrase [Gemmatimonadales bacterium]
MTRSRGQVLPRGKGAWLVRVSFGLDPATGRRIRRAKLVKGTKADATRELTAMLKDAAHGVRPLVEPGTRVRAYLIDATETHQQLGVQTKAKNVAAFRSLPDWIGNLPLRDLTTSHLDRLFAAMLEAGKTPGTVSYLHRIIRARLTGAVKRKLLLANPAAVANAPAQGKGETTALSAAEAARLTAVCRERDDGALWLLMLTTGLRPGELLALRWADFDGRRLQVRRALVRAEKGAWRFGPTKTKKERSVMVPSTVEALLRSHRARQATQRLQLGEHYRSDLDLIFAGPDGGPLWWTTLSRTFRLELRPAAGIARRVRPYDLRHSAATLLLEMGEHPKVVSELLGHSSVSITLDVYSHVAPNLLERVADRFDGLLGSVGTPTRTPASG